MMPYYEDSRKPAYGAYTPARAGGIVTRALMYAPFSIIPCRIYAVAGYAFLRRMATL